MRLGTLGFIAATALMGCLAADDGTKTSTAAQPVVGASTPAETAAAPPTVACPNFIDEDGDGVCDFAASGACPEGCASGGCPGGCAAGACAGGCGRFVDEDGDGACDRAQSGGCGCMGKDGEGAADRPTCPHRAAGRAQGPGFVDQDGDGVCDHHQRMRGTAN